MIKPHDKGQVVDVLHEIFAKRLTAGTSEKCKSIAKLETLMEKTSKFTP